MLVRSICRRGQALQKFPKLCRSVAGGENLSTQDLRQQLSLTVRKADREELLGLYAAATAIPKIAQSTAPPVKIESEMRSNVELRPTKPCPYATGCFATKDFEAGDVIIEITGEVSDRDTFESLQIREGQHLQMTKPAANLNHSCHPNGHIDFQSNLQYRALVPIKKGDELTWNYNTTEWVIQRPFSCPTGKCACIAGPERIKGFKYLSPEQQNELIPWVSPHIKALFEAKHMAGQALPSA